MATIDTDVKQLLVASSTFGPGEINQIREAISSDYEAFKTLRDAVAELRDQASPTPATKVRIGVGSFLLGRYQNAVDYLEKADGGALAQFYLGRSHFAHNEYDAADQSYQAAGKAGYDPDQIALARAEALRAQGKFDESLKLLDGLSGAVESTAEYLYQRGTTVAAIGDNPEEAIALYERAIEVDELHAGALFGLALENDRRGNDETATRLYEKSVTRFPPHVGTLLNLGILYEDRENYESAARCYQRILAVVPDHPRARMFLKDAESSCDMYYDEEAARRNDRLAQIMSVPVTDFELSVRSRNCLQKMGVRTLGDLTRTTEQDLLTSKNFGETSLNEIKEMLHSRGLRLGQGVEQKRAPEVQVDPSSMSPDEQATLSKPVADLNLSVRARKCMIRLGINTIGELVRCTGDELLECKNFGVTSLNEVREKLTAMSLKLRGD